MTWLSWVLRWVERALSPWAREEAPGLGLGPFAGIVLTTLAFGCTDGSSIKDREPSTEVRQPNHLAALRAVQATSHADGGVFGTLHGTRVEETVVRRALAGETVKVIVTLRQDQAFERASLLSRPKHSARLLAPVLSSLGPLAARVRHRFKYRPELSLSVDALWVDRLARRPDVEQITLDHPTRIHLAQGTSLIGAPNIWSAGHEGQGQTVAIIDTGVDYTHSSLGGAWGAKVVAGHDFVNDDTDPTDDNGHGTAVAGIVASTHGTNRGVAPAAELVALKTNDENGDGDTSDLIAALEWVITNRTTYGITVVNISLGGDVGPTAGSCNEFAASNRINTLQSQGVAVFVSAGNDGCGDRISFPACASGAISVGAVYDANIGPQAWKALCGPDDCDDGNDPPTCCADATTSASKVACYSNSDDLLDLLAPGNNCTTTNDGGGFVNGFGGTSAASPYAAGAGAVLLGISGNSLSPSQLRQLLSENGTSVSDPKSGLSKPLINLYESAIDLDPCLAANSDGDSCDDGNACTESDECSDQECSGTPRGCDDDNECTTDGCNPATGCTHVNNTLSCDDESACTENDACSGGTCSGSTLSCDDDNECTTDACNPASGCSNTNNTLPCDDGNACTSGEQCESGACSGGVGTTCDDDNACTTDSCDPETGCAYAANTLACNDNNLCTTGEMCEAGTCGGGVVTSCDDDNVCTTDSCDALLGCQHAANALPCDDGSVCTTGDVCSGGACGGTAIDCDDGNPCTTDSCDPVSGCTHVNNSAACDDTNPCTSGDACSGGACAGGPPTDCSDDNECTDDTCDPGSGCQHAPNTAVCEDGNLCTNDEVCAAGSCGGGVAITCDDENPCTNDACDPELGCSFAPNTAPCDDQDVCTLDDVCSGGVCAGTPLCDDGDPCTEDSCSTGNCSATPSADWSSCGDRRACFDGSCEPTPQGDVCEDAIELELGVAYEGELSGLHETGLTCGASFAGPDAFHEIVLPPGEYRIELEALADALDLALFVRSDCGGECLLTVDDEGAGTPEVIGSFEVEAEQTVVLQVAGQATAAQRYELLVSEINGEGGAGGASGTGTGGAATGGSSAEGGDASTAGPGEVDLGDVQASSDAGCGCRVAGLPRDLSGAWLVAVGAALAFARRRRPNR